MKALVIGADYIDKIVDKLREFGIDTVRHVTGRDSKRRAITIQANLDFVIVFTDFVNHLLMSQVKLAAKENRVPVIYCKRSVVSVEQELKRVIGN